MCWSITAKKEISFSRTRYILLKLWEKTERGTYRIMDNGLPKEKHKNEVIEEPQLWWLMEDIQ